MNLLDSLDPQAINRDTPIPCHYQLSELLRQEIEAGRWKVGEQIPVEEDLCAHFSLSRTTVRKSLDALVNQGLLQVVTQVLELHRIIPQPNVARELQLMPGETVIEIRRVRCILDQPVVVVSSYVPYELCPSLLDADLTHIGLYKFLREHGGYKTDRAKSFVEAVGANETEAQLLKVRLGSPLLMIESTVYLADGRPIDYYKSRHRGDRLRLIMESSENSGLTHVEAKL
jgi:GntR family transcriptional regulator